MKLAKLTRPSALFASCLVLLALASPSDAAAPLPTTPPSTAAALAALDRRIADLDAEEKASKEELTQLSTQIQSAHRRTLTHGRTYYRLTRAGMLPVGGGFDELVRHAMRVERGRRTVISDLAHEKTLRARAFELSQTLERGARDRVALASQRTSLDAARIAMDDENRRQAAFDKAFETSRGASEYVAVYGSQGVANEPTSAGFSAARGRLLFPLAGRAEVRAARREGTDGPALEIVAAAGTPVRAVFAGRVAFADRYGPYGRIVILDHGDHYYSVSGNLATIDVRMGGELAAGDRVGTVGDEGHGAMLYFEIRHGSQTVAPGAWLGL